MRRPNSGEAAVVGGNRLFGCSPPAGKPLTGGNRQLRSAGRSSEVVVVLGRLNSGERMLAGGECVVGGRTPAKPRWSEVMIFLDVFLRRRSPCPEENVSSDEQGAHRKTVLRQVAQLRGANVGRRRVRGGRPNSGEAAVVGGNNLFGCFPPAGKLLPGGKRQLR